MTKQDKFKSAFIALTGRPNSGKSSLMNTVLGEQLSVVTPLPQTTRRNIKGIYTAENMQLIFVDTPGIHKGRHTFNEVMISEAREAIIEKGVDIVCYIVDLSRSFGDEEKVVADLVVQSGIKSIIVFNKVDITKDCDKTISGFYELFPELKSFPSIKISAIHPDAKQIFINQVEYLIPEGPRYYDSDEMTDANLRFFAAEYIRKHIILNTRDEVPHASFVEIESYQENENIHIVNATIHVETVGQRGILIGKGGLVIRKIRNKAELDLKKLLQVPVKIKIHIKITPKWRDNESFLRIQGITLK
ncbi:MAG: GTPase Era [Fibrobacter sp.]|nr:GTPase Era [Fibrobacter sp.]